MIRAFLALSLLVCASVFSYPSIPNENWSPGTLCTTDHEDFTEYRYSERIAYCERNVSSGTKGSIYDRYSIPKADRKSYTIDHVIPLSIGGDNARRNLWPEHKKVKATRPGLETQVYISLRDGKISQKEAVDWILEEKFSSRLIESDWVREEKYASRPEECQTAATW